ncbi:MAG: YgcG family protein, partial [Spirochaetia bacterium]|nr:YgcG family protein [Spirochaetia bacterium]
MNQVAVILQKFRAFRILFPLILILSYTAACSEKSDIPELKSRVTDLAEILSPQTEAELEALLQLHEEKTTNQIAVLTIPSLNGEPLEEYSMRVVEKWKLGQKDKDNGVLILIAKKDRKIRIEVGYGLEGDLTDVFASLIIRNDMAPRFKAEDYDGGVKAGVESVIQILNGNAEEYLSKTLSGSEEVKEVNNSIEVIAVKALIYFLWAMGIWAGILITSTALFFPDSTGWSISILLFLIYSFFAYFIFGETFSHDFMFHLAYIAVTVISIKLFFNYTNIGETISDFILTLILFLIWPSNWFNKKENPYSSEYDPTFSSFG